MSIPLFKVFMSENAKENVGNVLSSGMITQGSQVEKFENELKKFFDYPYVLTVNSATSGLTLAYRLLNLRYTDTVISTPLTCFATNVAIMSNNLHIKWGDVDMKNCNINIDDVRKCIDKNTRALGLVHWGGNPVNMDRVDEIVKYTRDTFGNDLHIVEDCAHAFGAEWNGKKLGTTGKSIAVYSTQAIKHLTTGDGGIMLLPNEEMYNRAKLLRWYGIDRDRRSLAGSDFRLEPDISEFGYKFHMNDINAIIGLSNLPYMHDNLKKCAENGAYYNENLRDIFGLELLDYPKSHTPSYWIYTVRVLFELKNKFMNYMTEQGIVVSQVHARNDRHSCVKQFRASELPNLNKLEKQICSIPVGWWITQKEREYIVNSIRNFFNENVRVEQLRIEDIEQYKELLFNMNGYMSDDHNSENIEGIYIVKNDESKLISSAKLHIEKKIYDNLGHIQDVVTQPKMRGMGYGRALINFLTKKANENGCYKVILSSIAETGKFYESCGFIRSGYTYTYRTELNSADLFVE